MNVRACFKKEFFVVFAVALFLGTGCEKAVGLKAPATDAVSIFNEAWQVLDQRYALFSEKKINWDSCYTFYRHQVSETTTNEALFDVLRHMLEVLQDGHITLLGNGDTATYEGFYKNYPHNFSWSNVKNEYLQNQYKQSGPLYYKVADSIGYLYYASFAAEVPEAALLAVFNDMGFSKSLIVDVRDNTGGSTATADKLAGCFVAVKTLARYELQKSGPQHDAFSAPQPFFLTPTGPAYRKPVIVLTNRRCFSACNDFVLALSQLPQVTIVGDQTGGGGGFPNRYMLANGWMLQYTASKTLSAANAPVEAGIAPDVYVGFEPADEAFGKDPILEKALQLLR